MLAVVPAKEVLAERLGIFLTAATEGSPDST